MFSKRSKPRSIASQLILLFTIATALLLATGLGAFYVIVVRHAFVEDNAILADKVLAVTTDLHESGPAVFAEELQSRRGGEHATYWIRILDSQGGIYAETPGMSQLLTPDVFPTSGKSTSAFRGLKRYRVGAKLFSLVAVTGESGDQAYTLQLAQDRSSDEVVEREFAVLFIVILAISIAAAALIAVTVTRRGLGPLREMTESVARVGPTHLNERLAPTNWPQELQPLAHAFDDMLKRLDESFTRLSQFSADLAHELRTPVTNMMGEAQVALTRERSATEYRETIESTVAECERLARIVDNLLFVARADAARDTIAREQFDARAAIDRVIAFYEAVAEDHHVTLDCSGEGRICADPNLFERAVANLLDNALRFTPANGAIHIALAEHDTSFEVAVTDNGCGIAPEHVPHVFDRFYRGDASRGSDGAGLGLALVKSIAELHGGSATIDTAVDRGTTVKLIFPIPHKKI